MIKFRKNSFLLWLSNQSDRNDPIGDLASHLKRDMEYDEDVNIDFNYRKLKIHMRSKFAHSQALKALDEAYSEWKLMKSRSVKSIRRY